MIPILPGNPLAEVFGYSIHNDSPDVRRHRDHKLCPFNNRVPQCTKVSKTHPIGVCSVYHRQKPVITCPVRFREDWTMIADAADLFFGPGALYTSLPEVRLKDANGRKAGNIDYVLVKHDERGRILDYASLEVQAVYISGTIKGAFETYMERQDPGFQWLNVRNYPNPDYLSSSTKRLLPQILIKGGIFKQWKRQQAVAVQRAFFDTLPPLISVPAADADLSWLLYDLRDAGSGYKLTHVETVYTKYSETLAQFIDPGEPDEAHFIRDLERAVVAKLNGQPLAIPEDTDSEDDDEL